MQHKQHHVACLACQLNFCLPFLSLSATLFLPFSCALCFSFALPQVHVDLAWLAPICMLHYLTMLPHVCERQYMCVCVCVFTTRVKSKENWRLPQLTPSPSLLYKLLECLNHRYPFPFRFTHPSSVLPLFADRQLDTLTGFMFISGPLGAALECVLCIAH